MRARLLAEVAGDPSDWAERRREGCRAADLLEAAGLSIYRVGKVLFDRQVRGRKRTLSPFARSRLIPEFALRDRHGWARKLQRHAAQVGPTNLHVCFFTLPSVRVKEIPAAITAIGSNLSERINGDPELQRLGVQVHFRGTEWNVSRKRTETSLSDTMPAGRWGTRCAELESELWANVHANAAVYCPGGGAVWSQAWGRIKKRWGHKVMNGKMLHDAEAFGRYAHKAAALPDDLSPAEAKQLHLAAHKRRLVVWMRAAKRAIPARG